MPYSHIATEERDLLQSAFALSIDKSIIARILGEAYFNRLSRGYTQYKHWLLHSD